jgi:hypothetical protein
MPRNNSWLGLGRFSGLNRYKSLYFQDGDLGGLNSSPLFAIFKVESLRIEHQFEIYKYLEGHRA